MIALQVPIQDNIVNPDMIVTVQPQVPDGIPRKTLISIVSVLVAYITVDEIKCCNGADTWNE